MFVCDEENLDKAYMGDKFMENVINNAKEIAGEYKIPLYLPESEIRRLDREEAVNEGLFGIGDNRSDLREMLGDYVALAISDKSLFKTHYEAQKMVANHAGLTRQELTIPLIVVEKK